MRGDEGPHFVPRERGLVQQCEKAFRTEASTCCAGIAGDLWSVPAALEQKHASPAIKREMVGRFLPTWGNMIAGLAAVRPKFRQHTH